MDEATHESLFGSEAAHRFAALDVVMPHPVFGRNYWVCVLYPSDSTFETVKPLPANVHALAVKRYKRPGRGGEEG